MRKIIILELFGVALVAAAVYSYQHLPRFACWVCWRKRFKGYLGIPFAGALLIANPCAATVDFSIVKVISPHVPGSPADMLIRSFGQRLQREVGMNVVPHNLPSADLGESLRALERGLNSETLPILVLSYSDLAKPAPTSALGGKADPSVGALNDIRFVETIASVPNVLVAPSDSKLTLDTLLSKSASSAVGATPFSMSSGGQSGDKISVATPTTYLRDVEVLSQKRVGGLSIKPFRGARDVVQDVVKGNSVLGYVPIDFVKDEIRSGALKVIGRSGLNKLGSAEFQHTNRFEAHGVDKDTPDNTWYAVFVHKRVTAANAGKLADAIRRARQSDEFKDVLSREHSAFPHIAFPYSPRNLDFEQVWKHRETPIN
jgi:tripartite-type tricarboxylate transporter receptor subunit TctC